MTRLNIPNVKKFIGKAKIFIIGLTKILIIVSNPATSMAYAKLST